MGVNRYLWTVSFGSLPENPSALPFLGGPTEQDLEGTKKEREEAAKLEESLEKAYYGIFAAVAQLNKRDRYVELRQYLGELAFSLVGSSLWSYPLWVLRHREQLRSVGQPVLASPMSYFALVKRAIRDKRISHLYPGIGCGLLMSGNSFVYESVRALAFTRALDFSGKGRLWVRVSVQAILECSDFLVHSLLHPLRRILLIKQIQGTASNATRSAITTWRDALAFYKRDLISLKQHHTFSNSGISFWRMMWPTYAMGVLSTATFRLSCRIVFHGLLGIGRLETYLVKRWQPQEISDATSEDPPSLHLPDVTAFTAQRTTQTRQPTTKIPVDPVPRIDYFFVCGRILADVVNRFIMWPLDTVLLRLAVQGTGVLVKDTSYTGVFDCIRQVYRLEGLQGFYKGAFTSIVTELAANYILLEGLWVARLVSSCVYERWRKEQDLLNDR